MPVVTFSQAFMTSGLICPPRKKKIQYCDKDCPGLLVEVRQATGSVPTWYVRYKQPTTKYKRLGDIRTMTVVQARKAALLFKAQLADSPKAMEAPALAKEEMTLEAFVNQHVNPYNKMRKRSHRRDLQFYRRVGTRFGQYRLRAINRMEVQVFHNKLVTEEKLAPATADHHVVYMRRVLNLAVQWEFLEKNPLKNIPLMKIDNKVERYLSDDEAQRLVEVLTTDLAYGASYILLFLLSTGARLNEAMQAQWEQIDRSKGVWRIPATNTKSNKARSVPLNDSAVWVLDQLWTEGRHPYLFVNARTNKPFVTITRAWYRLRLKAGIEGLRIHDLRHSFASFLVNGGRSLYEVQQILGHSDPKVTMRYAHLSAQALQQAANAASVIVKKEDQQKAA